MSKYLSKEVVCAAYRKLSEIDPKKEQGLTQKVSALKYTLALGRFSILYKRDVDLKSAEDKKSFIECVGEVVKVDKNCAITNFFDQFDDNLSKSINSNFYSQGAVADSKNNPNERYTYPKRWDPLFELENCVLYVNSINSSNFKCYLPTPTLRGAMIAWLERDEEIDNGAEIDDLPAIFKEKIAAHYGHSIADGLWGDSMIDLNTLGIDIDNFFDDSPCVLHREDLRFVKGPHNLIYSGAPGTGKSHKLNQDASDFGPDAVRRVTFYPDYTYSQFVGCFKPFSEHKPAMKSCQIKIKEPTGKDEVGDLYVDGLKGKELFVVYGNPDESEDYVSYKFIPGPFLEIYVDAVLNKDKPYLLIIEELNRANAAAVFGDVFQLLDRWPDSGKDKDHKFGRSEYSVATSKEVREFLRTAFDKHTSEIEDEKEMNAETARLVGEENRLSLPPNMYIWATMNNADQGVFPMDTAFKRRWDFRYIDIDENQDAKVTIDGEEKPLSEVVVTWGNAKPHEEKWNDLRKAINMFLSVDVGVNEDKLLGPFFLKPASLTDEGFAEAFKNKVLLYLYEDVCKTTKRSKVFAEGLNTYPAICKAFDEGNDIFVDGFKERYEKVKAEAAAEANDNSDSTKA